MNKLAGKKMAAVILAAFIAGMAPGFRCYEASAGLNENVSDRMVSPVPTMAAPMQFNGIEAASIGSMALPDALPTGIRRESSAAGLDASMITESGVPEEALRIHSADFQAVANKERGRNRTISQIKNFLGITRSANADTAKIESAARTTYDAQKAGEQPSPIFVAGSEQPGRPPRALLQKPDLKASIAAGPGVERGSVGKKFEEPLSKSDKVGLALTLAASAATLWFAVPAIAGIPGTEIFMNESAAVGMGFVGTFAGFLMGTTFADTEKGFGPAAVAGAAVNLALVETYAAFMIRHFGYADPISGFGFVALSFLVTLPLVMGLGKALWNKIVAMTKSSAETAVVAAAVIAASIALAPGAASAFTGGAAAAAHDWLRLGLLGGGAVGGILGALLGLFAAGMADRSVGTGELLGTMLEGAVFGLLLLGAIGGFLGFLISVF